MTAIPSPALVVLVGPSGAGKTTWAREHFAANEIVSSDALRAAVGSGEGDLDASTDAFAVLDAVVAARVRRGLNTVIDTLGLDAAGGRPQWRSAAAPGCRWSRCGSAPPWTCAGPATGCATGRCRRRR